MSTAILTDLESRLRDRLALCIGRRLATAKAAAQAAGVHRGTIGNFLCERGTLRLDAAARLDAYLARVEQSHADATEIRGGAGGGGEGDGPDGTASQAGSVADNAGR